MTAKNLADPRLPFVWQNGNDGRPVADGLRLFQRNGHQPAPGHHQKNRIEAGKLAACRRIWKRESEMSTPRQEHIHRKALVHDNKEDDDESE